MKKNAIAILMAGFMMIAAGCGNTNGDTISLVSREDGSGTRGAFIELFGIEEKNADGEKIDNTSLDAAITNSTSVMLTTVAGDVNAIGYVSLGSLSDTVKALAIDGAEATAENVVSGSYKISRPFNIATKPDLSDAAKDFISFIMSDEGQAIVTDAGYIAVKSSGAYKPTGSAGKVTVAGSSSIAPVMEKLKEGYLAINSGAAVEIQQSDSTTGMNNVSDGICDIGMASRALKDSELATGIAPTVIATDGIAVIVNNDSEITALESSQVKDIFTGKITSWADVK